MLSGPSVQAGSEPGSHTGTHERDLGQRLRDSRQLSQALAAPLSDEDQTVQAMDDASPTKWHLAHTTWFYEAFILRAHLPGYQPFSDDFDYCFNSYYETKGDRHPRARRGLLTRPSAAQVRDYRAYVDKVSSGCSPKASHRCPPIPSARWSSSASTTSSSTRSYCSPISSRCLPPTRCVRPTCKPRRGPRR